MIFSINRPLKAVFSKSHYKNDFRLLVWFNKPVNLILLALFKQVGRRLKFIYFPTTTKNRRFTPALDSHHAGTYPFPPYSQNPSPLTHHHLSSISSGPNRRRILPQSSNQETCDGARCSSSDGVRSSGIVQGNSEEDSKAGKCFEE